MHRPLRIAPILTATEFQTSGSQRSAALSGSRSRPLIVRCQNVATEVRLQSSIFLFFNELRAANLANEVLLQKCGKTGSHG